MDPTQLLSLLTAHNYLALAVVVIGYVVQITRPDSKFPLSIPPIYGRDPKPLVALLAGIAYGALIAVQGGDTWQQALLHGAKVGLFTAGLYAVVIKFVFNGNAPAWLNAIALIFPAKPSTPAVPADVDSEPTPVTKPDVSVVKKSDPPKR